MEKGKLAPITFEILSHRLDQIITEAYYTLSHVSGSAIVMEAGDHQEAILDSKGDLVLFGAGLVHWTPSLSLASKYIVREYEDDLGIFEGDQFISNDPYTSVSHAPDVALIAPIFYKEQRIGFAATASHQMDVGGRDPGGIMVRPESYYEEGLQIPAMKITERGKWRKDIVNMIQALVRTPVFSILEIASKIAANNVIKARVVDLCERYGVDTVLTLFEQIQDISEEMVRARLRMIPDGRWRAVHYNEGINPEKLPYYRLPLTLTKEGDTLTYDMTGCTPQSPQCENSAYPATIGNLLGSYVVALCHDIPWSSGIHRPIKFIIPEDTIANARKPAGCSYTTPTGSGYAIEGLGQEVMAKMLQTSEVMRKECCGAPGAVVQTPGLGGINHDGTYFTTSLMDGIAGGGGGCPDMDGDAASGNMWCPKNMISDVEMNEMLYPVLILYRKEIPDTGGPGKFRGGNAFMTAWVPWDTESPLSNVQKSLGFDARSGTGASGGYPAPNIAMHIIRNSDLKERFKRGEFPKGPEEIGGKRDYPYPKSFETVNSDDVSVYWMGGGGGYGDPLERDPELVLKDVREGEVTIKYAKEAYGVVVNPRTLTIDSRLTEKQRKKMIQERLREGVK
jgi:N-methylhydantoinase B